jgi:hypothetical protein
LGHGLTRSPESKMILNGHLLHTLTMLGHGNPATAEADFMNLMTIETGRLDRHRVRESSGGLHSQLETNEQYELLIF